MTEEDHLYRIFSPGFHYFKVMTIVAYGEAYIFSRR